MACLCQGAGSGSKSSSVLRPFSCPLRLRCGHSIHSGIQEAIVPHGPGPRFPLTSLLEGSGLAMGICGSGFESCLCPLGRPKLGFQNMSSLGPGRGGVLGGVEGKQEEPHPMSIPAASSR